MKIIRLSFLTAVWLMTAHRLPAPIRSVRKNHSIGNVPVVVTRVSASLSMKKAILPTVISRGPSS
jgi:hypothetical protein